MTFVWGMDAYVKFFSNMLLAGTIIFGGGPVVIPLLRDYVVVEGEPCIRLLPYTGLRELSC